MIIENGVEISGKTGEFCRMNTVCTYTANFKRTEIPNSPLSEISFKYEILVDKTMWAVCGRGSGTLYIHKTKIFICINKLISI